MSRIAAIHQPNFFPWLGYFDKLVRSDVFVILDDVQYPRTSSGTWCNRVKLLVGGDARWATAPVSRPRSTDLISQVRWADGPWRTKLRASITQSYARSAHFDEAMAVLVPLIDAPDSGLAAYNLRAIRTIADVLRIQASIELASSFPVSGGSNERLANLVRAVDCDTYLVGGGAQGYRDDGVFERVGVQVVEQGFVHPEYPQRGTTAFIPGLSIIDALMNCGIDGTRKLLQL